MRGTYRATGSFAKFGKAPKQGIFRFAECNSKIIRAANSLSSEFADGIKVASSGNGNSIRPEKASDSYAEVK